MNRNEPRAPNLILVNIPESNRENVDDRKKDDENLIRETLTKTELGQFHRDSRYTFENFTSYTLLVKK